MLELWTSTIRNRGGETIHYRNSATKALMAVCGFDLKGIAPRDAEPNDRLCWQVRDDLYRVNCCKCLGAVKRARMRSAGRTRQAEGERSS